MSDTVKQSFFQPHSVQSVLKESLNCIQFFLALYFKKLNSKTWREPILQLRGSRLSPGLPYLLANTMSDSFRFCNSTFGACEKHFLRDVRSSIFPHNQSFTKERKGERRRCRVILMNLWQGFFFFPPLYHPVDSFSDSYKTHPTLVSVFHWIGWRYLLYWLTLRNCFEQISQISRVKHSSLGKYF